MPEEPLFNLQLTADEARLLADAASERANQFVRSNSDNLGDPALHAEWRRNAELLRKLAVRLSNLS